MSMLSLQTDQLRELAARSEDRELINALHGAAETIENLILKNEALPKVIATYPNGTIVVRVEDLEKVNRVMVDTGHYCKMFYKDGLSCKGCKHDGQFENEFEYGYPCPCIRCKRRAIDNYECFVQISEKTEEEAVKIWKRIEREDD